MDPDKARAIVDWPQSTTQMEVQQLLGLWNVYQSFIPGYAGIVASVTNVLKGNNEIINWGDSQKVAFLKMTVLFTSSKTPILWHDDLNRPAPVKAAGSDIAMDAVLSHKFQDAQLCTVSSILTKRTPAECNYNIFYK
jgi:hypothetical protein